MGGIYWADEIPDILPLQRLAEPDRTSIFHLFRIRFQIWDRKELTLEDRRFWDLAHVTMIVCRLAQFAERPRSPTPRR